MSILQPDAPEHELASKVVIPSEASIELLESPKRKIRKPRGMPMVLWTLLLALGILILVVRTPLHAPAFESLTQYVCDPLPRKPIQRYRINSYPIDFKCRAGDQVLYQRLAVIDGSNPLGLKACTQDGGPIRIWRMPTPSEYGAYVFHSTCGDHITMYYKFRAATYESKQIFSLSIACLAILTSLTALGVLLIRHRRSSKPQDQT